MKVVLYARVSTNSEDQLNSLENQIKMFHEYVSDNKLTLVETGVLYKKNGIKEILSNGCYADEGISGKSLKRREAFQQLLIDAKEKQFDTIIVKSVSRFGRSVEDVSRAVKDLKELGVGVFFLDLKVNSLDSSKEFMINLFASLAQEESNNKSYIVQVGIRRAQKDGKFTAGIPFGYDIDKGYLHINPGEASIVRKIYDLYLNQGFGTGKIARYLNREEIKTKKGTQWSQIQISRILENVIYKGIQIQHITQTTDINRDIRIEIPESEWITQEIKELVIIDNETYRLVQIEKQKRLEMFGHIQYVKKKYIDENNNPKVVNERKILRGTGRHSNQHLLSNLLFCGNCGGALKRKKRHGKNKYKDLGYEWSCRMNDMYGSNVCSYRNAFPEDYIVEYVRENIRTYREDIVLKSPEDGLSDAEVYIQKYIDAFIDPSKLYSEANELNEKSTKMKHDREKNFQLYSNDAINMTEYKARNNAIEKELMEIQSKINRIKTLEQEIEDIKLQYGIFMKFLFEVDIENITNSDLKKIINKIEIKTYDDLPELAELEPTYPKVIHLDWKFLDKSLNQMFRENNSSTIRGS